MSRTITLPIAAPELDREFVVQFTVKGEPISKARARFTKQGSKTSTYTPQKTLDGERAIAAAYLAAARKRGTDPDAAYAVHAEFYNGTRQRRDVDNMVKLVLDGLNKWAFPDDNQVIEIMARKLYVPKAEARTVVTLYRVGAMGAPTQPCLQCGKPFRTYESWQSDPNGQKFCSRACGNQHRIEKRERTCLHCAKSFLAWGETHERIYCSVECKSADKRASIACSGCGENFTKQRSLVRRSNYCSDECRVVAAKTRKSKHYPGTCGDCGGGTTRKEYTRCQSCKAGNQKVTGKPKKATEGPARVVLEIIEQPAEAQPTPPA